MHRRALALVVAAALAAPGARAADALTQALRAWDMGAPGDCLKQARLALAGPAGRDARVDAWRVLGLCAAALGERAQAQDAFLRMLAIHERATLPDDAPAPAVAALGKARADLDAVRPLGITAQRESVDGGTRTVRLEIVDGLDMVHQVAWRGAAGSTGGPFRKAARMELELPAEADVTVQALDAAGGEVALLFFAAAAAQSEAPAPPQALTQTPAELEVPWGLVGLLGGGVVVIGVGVGAALVFTSPRTVTVTTGIAFP